MTAGAALSGATMPGVTGIAGELAICDRRGALWLPEYRLLAVSDLHLEKGSSYARRGVMLPPYDTAATLARLATVVADYDPEIVVSLGDSFHDGQGSARLPDIFRSALEALSAGRDWYWVTGNHDPDAPEGLSGRSVTELSVGRLTFRHEPVCGAGDGEVAGHLHPGARIVRSGRSVRRACFAGDGRRLVMPAFGAYTGCLNVLDRAYRNLFDWTAFRAHVLGRERVYAIGLTALRPG